MKIRDQRKELIMKVATALFAKNGFEKTSIMEICNEADVNNSMISYYFGGKVQLYNEIINNFWNEQNKYISDLIAVKDFSDLSDDEKSAEFSKILDKFFDIFYGEVSADLIVLFLREQQNQNFEIIRKSPTITYFREIIASILDMPENSKTVVYCTLAIIAQMASPRILPGFSLGILQQKDFMADDIEMIRNHLKWFATELIAHVSGKSRKMSLFERLVG